MHAAELGLSAKEAVTNVITALTSSQMLAPTFWVDPKNGNDYMLTVQYPEEQVQSIGDLSAIPLHGNGVVRSTRLDMISKIDRIQSPTEVDHSQIRRVVDVYVRPAGEDLGGVARQVEQAAAAIPLEKGTTIQLAGIVQSMRTSFRQFALGIALSLLLLYLILVAQFKSFADPLIILTAFPPALAGVLSVLHFTGTTINLMSLMGVVMMAGIVLSNSILIVDFAQRLRAEDLPLRQAIANACEIRLRPILMTSLATIAGLLPMAAKLGEGSDAYAPLARSLLGGVASSLVFTLILVPVVFYLAYRHAPVPNITLDDVFEGVEA
jgi:multidrug efflux pump subunit AcrB